MSTFPSSSLPLPPIPISIPPTWQTPCPLSSILSLFAPTSSLSPPSSTSSPSPSPSLSSPSSLSSNSFPPSLYSLLHSSSNSFTQMLLSSLLSIYYQSITRRPCPKHSNGRNNVDDNDSHRCDAKEEKDQNHHGDHRKPKRIKTLKHSSPSPSSSSPSQCLCLCPPYPPAAINSLLSDSFRDIGVHLSQISSLSMEMSNNILLQNALIREIEQIIHTQNQNISSSPSPSHPHPLSALLSSKISSLQSNIAIRDFLDKVCKGEMTVSDIQRNPPQRSTHQKNPNDGNPKEQKSEAMGSISIKMNIDPNANVDPNDSLSHLLKYRKSVWQGYSSMEDKESGNLIDEDGDGQWSVDGEEAD